MTSKLDRFVGREAELQKFLDMIEKAHGEERVMFIWGPGGIGKTWLMQAILYEAKNNEGILVLDQSLDMYSTRHRTIEGTTDAIVESLQHIASIDPSWFEGYNSAKLSLLTARQQAGYSQEGIEQRRQQLTREFRSCLNKIVAQQLLVLAFDTFEHVQETPVGKWILDNEGLQMPNVFCVIASRKPNPLNPQQPPLSGLSLADAVNFYQKYVYEKEFLTFNDSTASKPNYPYIAKLNEKVGQNPLLLGLALWSSPLTPTVEELDKLTQIDFERQLVALLNPYTETGPIYYGAGDLSEALAKTLIYMAYLNRRFTPELLERLVAAEYITGTDHNELWLELQRQLPEFFFVKTRPGNNLQLHDKLAEMIRIYLLPVIHTGPFVNSLRTLAKDVVRWYDELIELSPNKDQQDRLRAEQFAYVMQFEVTKDYLRQPQLLNTKETQQLKEALPADYQTALQLLDTHLRQRSDYVDRLLLNELLSGDIDDVARRVIDQIPALEQRYAMYNKFAEMAARIYEYKQAQNFWRSAFLTAQAMGDSRKQIEALIGEHNSTWQTDPARSLTLLAEARTLANSAEDLLPLVFYEIGYTHRQLHNLAESVKWYQQALDKAKQFDQATDRGNLKTLIPKILNDMGFARGLLGDYDAALSHVRHAAKLRERNRDRLWRQIEEFDRRLTAERDQTTLNELQMNRLIIIEQHRNALRYVGMTDNTLGELMRFRGDLAGAIGYYSEALSIFNQLNDHYWLARSLHSRGETFRRLSMNLHDQGRREASDDYDRRAYEDIRNSQQLCERYGIIDLSDVVNRRMGRLLHDRALRHSMTSEQRIALLNESMENIRAGLQIAQQTKDILEELECLTEIAFLADDFATFYKEQNNDNKLTSQQYQELAGYIDELSQCLEQHRNNTYQIFQFPVFDELLHMEQAAFDLVNEKYDSALEKYIDAFTKLALESGYGAARYRAHIDHLLRNIQKFENPTRRKEWYQRFVETWITLRLPNGESFTKVYPNLIHEFELNLDFDY